MKFCLWSKGKASGKVLLWNKEEMIFETKKTEREMEVEVKIEIEMEPESSDEEVSE